MFVAVHPCPEVVALPKQLPDLALNRFTVVGFDTPKVDSPGVVAFLEVEMLRGEGSERFRMLINATLTVGYNFVNDFGTPLCQICSRTYSREYQYPSAVGL